MELERHVLSAIEDHKAGRLDSALMHACIALDGTARRVFPNATVGRTGYKNCIRKYYWIIEPMIGGGLNLEDTKWENVPITEGKHQITAPDLADIIYHIFRCSHAHARAVPKNYELLPVEDGRSTWIAANGILQMPERIIWALLAVSVFSSANSGIQTAGNYYLSWGSERLGIGIFKFVIRDWWGREDDFRSFLSRQNPVRIKLENLKFAASKP